MRDLGLGDDVGGRASWLMVKVWFKWEGGPCASALVEAASAQSASSRPLPIPTLTMCTAAQRALPSSPDCLKTRLWRQGNAALLHLPATSHTPIGYAPSILSNTGTSSSPASRTATGRSRLRDRRTRSRRLRQRRYEGLARQTHPPPTRHSISRRQCHLPTMRCASP